MVTCLFLEQEVWGLNLGLVKSEAVKPTARHHCNISGTEAVLLGRNDNIKVQNKITLIFQTVNHKAVKWLQQNINWFFQ